MGENKASDYVRSLAMTIIEYTVTHNSESYEYTSVEARRGK